MPPPAEGLASRLVLGPALRTQPDRRLVTLVREGYEAAFEEIVRRYGKPLGRYAAAIVGSRAEDVTQDAFSKALLALRRDGAEIELRPWLYRIVRNTALNDLRDRPPAPEVLAEAIAGGRSPSEEVEQRDELAELIKRLRSLPEPQRAAIVMRELEGLSHEEIAAALGLSGGGARQAIYRARQALRDGLGVLLPLPLVRLLVDHGAGATATGAGAGAGGAVIAAGASAGGAGAGSALKAGAVVAVLAGSVGSGVALQEDHGGTAGAVATPQRSASPPAGPASTLASIAESRSPLGGGGGHNGRGGRGDDGQGGRESNRRLDEDREHGEGSGDDLGRGTNLDDGQGERPGPPFRGPGRHGGHRGDVPGGRHGGPGPDRRGPGPSPTGDRFAPNSGRRNGDGAVGAAGRRDGHGSAGPASGRDLRPASSPGPAPVPPPLPPEPPAEESTGGDSESGGGSGQGGSDDGQRDPRSP